MAFEVFRCRHMYTSSISFISLVCVLVSASAALHFYPNICTPAIGPVRIGPVLLHDQSFERHVTNLPWRALHSSRFTPS